MYETLNKLWTGHSPCKLLHNNPSFGLAKRTTQFPDRLLGSCHLGVSLSRRAVGRQGTSGTIPWEP